MYYVMPLNDTKQKHLSVYLTSATRQNIASLPARRAWPPHAVMLTHDLASLAVRAGHLAWLETMSSTGGGALCPWPYSPMKCAGLRGAVLQRTGPWNTNMRIFFSEIWYYCILNFIIQLQEWTALLHILSSTFTFGVHCTSCKELWCRLYLGSKHGDAVQPNWDPHIDHDTRTEISSKLQKCSAFNTVYNYLLVSGYFFSFSSE